MGWAHEHHMHCRSVSPCQRHSTLRGGHPPPAQTLTATSRSSLAEQPHAYRLRWPPPEPLQRTTTTTSALPAAWAFALHEPAGLTISLTANGRAACLRLGMDDCDHLRVSCSLSTRLARACTHRHFADRQRTGSPLAPWHERLGRKPLPNAASAALPLQLPLATAACSFAPLAGQPRPFEPASPASSPAALPTNAHRLEIELWREVEGPTFEVSGRQMAHAHA